MRSGLFATGTVISALLLGSAGCTRTVYIPAERVTERHDTLRLTSLRIDSVVCRDSVSVFIAGDTVRETRWRERERWRTVTDTVRQTRIERDTVPIIIERQAEPGRIQRLKMQVGEAAMLLAGAGAVIAAILWLIRRREK